jgi:NADH dehydrogenase
MQSGLYAGRRIRHQISGRKPARPFRYYDLGSAAYLSRGTAVVSVGPLRFGGFLGWLAWLLIHIAFLTGFRNRAGAVLTWAAAFVRDVRRERAFTTAPVATASDVYPRRSGT